MDYQSNSKKSKEKVQPEKQIEKIVTGEVVVHKKSIGEKFRGLFVEADFGSVVRYVAGDVLVPALRNLIVDASTKGIERMIYGETRSGGYRRTGPKVTYNSPINRSYREPTRQIPSSRVGPRQNREDFVLSSREEAENVLEAMSNVIDMYDVVTVADLNDLLGIRTDYTDNKWGWSNVASAQIQQIREGYLLNLPPAEAL